MASSSTKRLITSVPISQHIRLLGTVPPTTIPGGVEQSSSFGYLAHAVQGLFSWGNNSTPPPPPDNSTVEPKHKIVRRISRTEVTHRTTTMIAKILAAENSESQLLRMKELCKHLQEYPPTKLAAAQNSDLIACLTQLSAASNTNDNVRAEARLCLRLAGIVAAPKYRGVNLLTIDGGGTRGMMGLEVMEALEKASGKKIHELFDHIVGVSTGAIIAVLLGIKKMSAKEAREVYKDISAKLFDQNRMQGAKGLLMNHAYYDTKKWIGMLKEIIGEDDMSVSGRDPNVPNISVVSSIVNLPVLQPFIFRNYEPRAGRESHYRGSTTHPTWMAVQASAAAPGYFEEVVVGTILHQDGGVIANNPAAIGVHEMKSIYPNEKINCLVSVGNGRTVQDLEPTPTFTNTKLMHKMLKIIDSATDTESVHVAMRDLLHEKVYYRFNPYMTHPYGLDEIAPARLDQMISDAQQYVRRNGSKIEEAATALLSPPNPMQALQRQIEALKQRKGFFKVA